MKDYVELLDTILDKKIREQAEVYFQKYWLDEDEYFEKWRPIQNAIFDDKAKHLPDMMFNVGFELFPMVGGDIFVAENDFTLLQDCMKQSGDEYFAIAQNRNVVIGDYDAGKKFNEEPFSRFRYPVNVSWSEMLSGGIVGSEHLKNGCKDYFVFGDSGNWARYVANSWIEPSNLTGLNPVIIMGFKKEYSGLFRKNFEPLRLLEPEITPDQLISQWLPQNYRERLV